MAEMLSAPWQRCCLLPEPSDSSSQPNPTSREVPGAHPALGMSWWLRRCWQSLAHLCWHHPRSGLQLEQPQKPSLKGGTTGLL